MGNAMIYAGIAIGVAAMAGIMVYAHDNQTNYLSDDAVLAPAAEQGAFSSETGMVQLNKEQWHEDPFGDLAAEVKDKYESGG
ncbi:hypothetical protein AAA799B03_01284 [Marine Group I thaumarchaeote SCGC AAA799-B03]|uniref:Uncharacterized protein n=3 Tax=Marine Group I TaxID=905826 RepID=A0A087S634_9ARCH|nr:hypothetical protein AAA799N04_01495 [Marine Group I thaumarchaeote SCGC AAA799-N04]KFM17918.1 hypothetical protein SCCGRSA3_01457 [Marine Group I thaumarchaeote SCGC RSA3]KFM21188.1 hypothetical protein AAA799B03_01284 [Marine Group I thaumarchaeote SCGC AAA799-B03]